VTGTGHPKIMRAEEERLSEEEVDSFTRELQQACDEHDCDAIQSILLDVVAGFDAKDGISDALWLRQLENGGGALSAERDRKVITGHFKNL
jgi:hypothetical protein